MNINNLIGIYAILIFIGIVYLLIDAMINYWTIFSTSELIGFGWLGYMVILIYTIGIYGHFKWWN